MVRYPCPCCGHLVFEEPPGSHAICAVCFWEDDVIQLRWPDWRGGANRSSLIEAQRVYAELRAMKPRFTGRVRPATASEPIDRSWRQVDLAVDDFEPRGVSEEPWPAAGTSLYWWRPDYWRRR
ncbi:CPCC family cysteine-rich protein [Amycolatopsis sp. NPDC049253]|uniref:CPCC family cysteine-rich protein n=1 Tax=Amycolatopsis sp. NPDC049253 TaxID=3155274 RepID=UPI00341E7D30